MDLLKVGGLWGGYRDKNILHNVEFSVEARQFLSIIGANGSGKSTLLKCISGVLAKTKGEIIIRGEPLEHYSPRELAKILAVVGDEANNAAYTVEQIVLMGRFAHIGRCASPSINDYAVVDQALHDVGIAYKRTSMFTALSQGERQKVLIARALAQQAQILLLDEPTAHLDIVNQYSILYLIKSLAEKHNMGVICVIHDINLAAEFSHQLLLLKEGRIVECGEPASVLQPHILQQMYGVPFEIYQAQGITQVKPFYRRAGFKESE